MSVTASYTVAETKNLIRAAFEKDEAATTPFRGESEATSAWRFICKRLGGTFIAQVLPESEEGTPAEAASHILDACYRNVDRVHPHLRECLAAASSKNPEDRRKTRLAQRNLFFLRFLSCACVHPSDWGFGSAGDEDVGGHLSPTRGASVGRELLKATSDVTSSSGAVQVFLDRLTDLSEHATVHPMDLRHFLNPTSPPPVVVPAIRANDKVSRGAMSPTRREVSDAESFPASKKNTKSPKPPKSTGKRNKSSESSNVSKRLDRLGLSPGRAHTTTKKAASSSEKSRFAISSGKTAKFSVKSGGKHEDQNIGGRKTSSATKKVSKSTPFDCFKLPMVDSNALLDSSWEGSGHSPKLPFDRSVADLDSDGVAQFLFVGGLPELIDVFRRNSVTGKQLSTFSDSDLEALGLSRDQRHAVSTLVTRHM